MICDPAWKTQRFTTYSILRLLSSDTRPYVHNQTSTHPTRCFVQ